MRVIKQGVLDTIQDTGRYGYQHLGINPGGSMDTIASAVANMLVGNNMHEAVIELHYPASSLLVEDNCMIALSGANFGATLNNQPIPINTLVIVSRDSLLQFTEYIKGARCYIAVQGGWDADYWLNSYSTHLKVSAGGFRGRPLLREDILKLKAPGFYFPPLAENSFVVTPVAANVATLYSPGQKIRCVAGLGYDWLSDDDKEIFFAAAFKISPQSDRMGYRLSGAILNARNDAQLLSSAVTRGAVQLLPSGQLIVLMADHQTTGGYTAIVHVISADIPKIAQMRPNEQMQFELITHRQAEHLYLEQQRHLQKLQETINVQLRQFFSHGND